MLFSRKFPIERRLQLAISFIMFSFLLVFLGLDRAVSSYLLGLGILGAAIAGAFYTFGITTPFAMVVILELMKMENGFLVAISSCLAATAVDCYLFHTVRDTLAANAKKQIEYFHAKFRCFKPLFPAAGFFIFGLPIPDEIGLALIEMSEIKLAKLALIIFSAKFLTLILIWKALGG